MELSNTYRKGQERMMSILGKLGNAAHSITPHMSDATSGIVNKLGIASVVTGGTNAIVAKAIETQDPTWLTVSNSVAMLSIVGSIMFIVKLSTDIYFARKKDKREQQEHDKKNGIS
jgi:hypothetical protein